LEVKMPAVRVDFTRSSEYGPCEQGATFRKSFQYLTETDGIETPVDLTGYLARMQVRSSLEATTPLLSISSDTGEITLGDEGVITVEIGAGVTAALPPTGTTGISTNFPVYDLELVLGATVTRLIEGYFEVKGEVTR
jgi:hypothetical protein